MPQPLALACGHELRAAGRRSTASSGPATTKPTRANRSCTRVSGRIRARANARRSRQCEHDPPVEALDDDVSDSAHDRPAPGFLQHRRAERRLRIAAAARRDSRHLARGRAPLRRAEGDRVRVTSRRGSVVVPSSHRCAGCARGSSLRPSISTTRSRRTCSRLTRPIRNRAPRSSKRCAVRIRTAA